MKNVKILFIALAHSTHTVSWIELFNDSNIDVAVFGINNTYSDNYKSFFYFNISTIERIAKKINRRTLKLNIIENLSELKYLKKVIKDLKPDIIHTLGFDPAGYEFLKIVDVCRVFHNFTWVHTSRGGPELALQRLVDATLIKEVLSKCDYFIADNVLNYKYAYHLGLDTNKAYTEFVPGTGGVDVELYKKREFPASLSRLILFPKAYECPASKALPVFEAIKNCWGKIKPCKIVFTAMMPETYLWFNTFPEEIRQACIVHDRIPRDQLFEYLLQARVVLAPSLIDGVPNLLYEAMAAGVLPIISPIDTLTSLFNNSNAIFARNLYPDEIEASLILAMNNDELVDEIVKNNIEFVRNIADRNIIKNKMIAFYNGIVKNKSNNS